MQASAQGNDKIVCCEETSCWQLPLHFCIRCIAGTLASLLCELGALLLAAFFFFLF